MNQRWLEELFERERPRLRAVAYRLLGSPDDAEDAVQEVWLRLNRSDSDAVENAAAWLATVVARISADLLRKRAVRAATSLDDVDPVSPEDHAPDPSVDSELVDAGGSAPSVVLERLSPPERFALVLHDVFGIPFDELGGIFDRTRARPSNWQVVPSTRSGVPMRQAREGERHSVTWSRRSWQPHGTATSKR
jgi:RNA polymerase sigma-70 factor (ECF subfamily)